MPDTLRDPARREAAIAFQTDKTPSEYRGLAELVDRYAFDVVSVYGDAPFQPSFDALLLMAPHLQRARIGVACVSPSRLPPIDMAGSIALLDHLTDGRAYLGIARGAWLARHGIRELTPPITAIRESVEIVDRLLGGLDTAYTGKVFQLEAGVRLPYPVRRPRVPILIGTWGRKLGALAGAIADEVKLGGCANPNMIPLMESWIAEGAHAIGRDPKACGVVVGAVTVVDADGHAAKQAVKRDLALYLPVIAALDQTLRIDPERLRRIAQYVETNERDAAAALISDDLLAKFALAGSPDEVLAHAQALYAAGARRVEFGTPHGLNPQAGIRLLGERVLPGLSLSL
jgi:5,10-methylenetetrahydromethanopterin reductase